MEDIYDMVFAIRRKERKKVRARYLSAAPKDVLYPRKNWNYIHNILAPFPSREDFWSCRLLHGADIRCNDLTPNSIVDCYYLFGETLFITTHLYGECPWKKL